MKASKATKKLTAIFALFGNSKGVGLISFYLEPRFVPDLSVRKQRGFQQFASSHGNRSYPGLGRDSWETAPPSMSNRTLPSLYGTRDQELSRHNHLQTARGGEGVDFRDK